MKFLTLLKFVDNFFSFYKARALGKMKWLLGFMKVCKLINGVFNSVKQIKLYSHIMEYHSEIKKNQLLPNTTQTS
jgi:hypothetical protein